MIIPKKNATVLVNHIFRVFDQDDNGFIDFKVCHYHYTQDKPLYLIRLDFQRHLYFDANIGDFIILSHIF